MTSRTKRPRDPVQLAKLIGDIATGQAADPEPSPRSKASRIGGIKGGASRAKALTAEQRTEIARTAAMVRWKKCP
ncbi:MAG: histone H1 [Terriglobia bacterium]